MHHHARTQITQFSICPRARLLLNPLYCSVFCSKLRAPHRGTRSVSVCACGANTFAVFARVFYVYESDGSWDLKVAIATRREI
jgi:hypothetical protein